MTEAQTGPSKTVVLIDDSEEILEVLRLALNREHDFTVVAEASDGEAGVAAVLEHEPDLVLLDIALPVMDGLQALQLIRQESPGTIVIMLTGFSEKAAALTAAELRAHGYIRKGGGVPELLSQIREILDVRSRP